MARVVPPALEPTRPAAGAPREPALGRAVAPQGRTKRPGRESQFDVVAIDMVQRVDTSARQRDRQVAGDERDV